MIPMNSPSVQVGEWVSNSSIFRNVTINFNNMGDNGPVIKPVGYKSIDIYGLLLHGTLHTAGVVEYFNANIKIEGQWEPFGTQFESQAFPVTTTPFLIGVNSIDSDLIFETPVKGVSNVCIESMLFTSKNSAPPPLSNIFIQGSISLTVLYKYQGQ
jgi:hypothetical protein